MAKGRRQPSGQSRYHNRLAGCHRIHAASGDVFGRLPHETGYCRFRLAIGYPGSLVEACPDWSRAKCRGGYVRSSKLTAERSRVGQDECLGCRISPLTPRTCLQGKACSSRTLRERRGVRIRPRYRLFWQRGSARQVHWRAKAGGATSREDGRSVAGACLAFTVVFMAKWLIDYR